MSEELHINTRRDIEYGYSISVDKDALLSWFDENEIPVYNRNTDEWEIERSYLEDLPFDAFKDIHSTFRGEDYIEIDRSELRELVQEMFDSEADPDYVYISWF